MARGITLSILNTLDGTRMTKTCQRFPVRIGRNSLNDVCLPLPFVSQFHAVIELREDELLLRDLGSTNGTVLRSQGHVPKNGYIGLAECNYEFFVLPFAFRVTPVEVDTPSSRRLVSAAEAKETALMAPSTASAPAAAEFASLYQAYRGTWVGLHEAIEQRSAELPSEAAKQAFLADLVRTYPALANEPEYRNVAAGRLRGEANRDVEDMRLATTALDEVRKLAAHFLALRGRLEGPDEIAAFAAEVTATLDVFFRCFLPLRDGHKQFETQMRLERGSRSYPGAQGLSVETAANVGELAGVMLDWRRDDQAHAATEGIFADIMIHQVALLNGVMEGVKTLLAELSPEAIEALAEKKQRGALGIGPFRYKQLWDAYAERHADLAEEERFAFELIFGPQFAAAYRRFHQAATLPTKVPTIAPAGATSPPPPFVPPPDDSGST